MKALIDVFNQEKALLVGAFSVIVLLHRLIVYSSVLAAALSASKNCVMWHPAHKQLQYLSSPLQRWEVRRYKLWLECARASHNSNYINYPTKLYSFSKLLILKLLTLEYQNSTESMLAFRNWNIPAKSWQNRDRRFGFK